MKTGRVVIFVAGAFGSIIIPVVVLMLVNFLTYKPPFIVESSLESNVENWPVLAENTPGVTKAEADVISEYTGARKAMRLTFAGGGRALIIQFGSKSEAGDLKIDLLDNIPTDRITSIMDLLTYHRSDDKAHGMLFQDRSWVILSEAPTEEGRITQLEDLPFLVKQKKSLISTLFEDYTGWVFGALGFYLLFLLISWPRAASWAAKVEPAPGVTPAEVSQVKNRLLAINDQDLPFGVRAGKGENEFIVEWKYVDAKWAGVMAAGGVKSIARIRLRLDPDRLRVRAQDTNGTVRWQTRANGGGMAASLKFSWFRGIEFYNYSKETVYGFVFKDGRLTFDQAYEYTFSRSEMKDPVIEVVTGSGWTYLPVVSFLPPFS